MHMHLIILGILMLWSRLTEADVCSCPLERPTKLASKRGIAYNDVNLANLLSLHCPACKWAYNWGSTREEVLNPDVEYVPMLWSNAPEHVRAWETQEKVDGIIFSFNEPDVADQSNMTAVEAAAAHILYMNSLPDQARVGTPSITSSSKPSQGLSWLKDFLHECQNLGGCRFDFCNTHWYSEAQWIEAMFAHLDEVHKVCEGKPVWLTEFAVQGTDEEVGSFLEAAVPRLERLPYLEAYSYFLAAQGSLVGSSGFLSYFGNIYATVS
ncbi:Glycoside hydrolase, subgroup, catalytic core [Cordyceps fumosorosea ARSEF 2679]|uniref:Glycoside hydrolase, subgroup, catalytic core n=1 Tax=Cordyceps fumosorosea (strain ARSEF 2679) TaxID=1081104 RepID=A0A166VSL6_CORFA|nr:Glycoside hydrolase, subgroup, catalytic core [Cordyceps fumosorosea ARSEF 2679]OAA33990.1 Glycoside hydrolase, subgroup, catalytic core [Cordyceps fumosorosea ARSEF 2679]